MSSYNPGVFPSSEVPVDVVTWDGVTYSPPASYTLQAVLLNIQQLLQQYFQDIGVTNVPVYIFPEVPTGIPAGTSPKTGPYVLVVYQRSTFSEPKATTAMLQERRMAIRIAVVGPTVQWRVDSSYVGNVFAVLQDIELALAGAQIPGFRFIRISSADFFEQSAEGRPWVYDISLELVGWLVSRGQSPQENAGLLQQAWLGLTGVITQQAASYQNVNFSNGSLQLTDKNVNQLVVSNPSTGLVYQLNVAYTLDPFFGLLTVVAGGGLSPSATVNVSYVYNEVTGSLASGGSEPLAPTN